MKTKITKLLLVLVIVSSNMELISQCTVQPMPAITGQTYAPCVGSNVFTIAANPTGSNVIAWYNNSWGGNAFSTNSVYVTPTITQTATYFVNQFNAQSTASIALPTFVNGYSGNTRGMWFQAPADFVITGIRVPLDVGGSSNSAIAVLKFPSAPPSFATVTNSFNTLYLNQNYSGLGIIPVNIPVYSGDYIGLLGARGNVTSYGPTNPIASTLGTNTLTLTRMGMQYVLASQTPTDIWQEPAGSLGRIEVYTTLGCLSPMAPVTVSVAPAPQILIGGPSGNICANSTTTLTATGVSSYTWFSGSNATSITVTPSVNTTYSVIGSISPTCGTSASITITVDPGVPVLTVTPGNGALCSGNTATFTASGAASYSWTGGIQNGVSFTPTVTNTYTVTGSNSCGSVTALRTLTVNITPTLQIPASATVCEGSPITLTVGGASTYTWLNTNQTGTQIVLTTPTNVLVQVIGLSAENCSASASQAIVVSPLPVMTAYSSNQTICSGKSATLTATGNANIFAWPGIASAAVTVVSPLASTVYSAIGIFTATGCSKTLTVNVNLFAPVPSISSNTSVCLGSAVTLTAGGASNFTWNPGAVQFNPFSPTPSVNTTYTVAGMTNSFNISCPGTNTVMVTVNALPTVAITSTRSAICKGEKTILNATGASSYTWTNVTSNNASVQVNPSSQMLYLVNGLDANGCAGTGTILVKVSSCTGIDEAQALSTEVMIYPNPSNGNFFMKSNIDCDFQIYNGLGQVVRKGELESGTLNEISGLSSGSYFIRLSSGNGSAMEKIVVK